MADNRNTNQTVDKAADAGRKIAEESARTASAATDQATRNAEQATRMGADAARQGADTARDTLQSGLNSAVQGFQGVTDQMTKVLGFTGPQADALAKQSSQNMEAVSQASTVIAKGVQEFSQEWFGLAQNRFQKNMEAMNRLVGCRSVQDFVAVQSDLVRDNLRESLEGGRRLAEVSVRVAEEATKTIQSQASGSADRFRRVA